MRYCNVPFILMHGLRIPPNGPQVKLDIASVSILLSVCDQCYCRGIFLSRKFFTFESFKGCGPLIIKLAFNHKAHLCPQCPLTRPLAGAANGREPPGFSWILIGPRRKPKHLIPWKESSAPLSRGRPMSLSAAPPHM